MFAVLLGIFIIFVAVYALFTTAVIYHLRSYTMPGWIAPRIVLPIYLGLCCALLGLALYSLSRVPKNLTIEEFVDETQGVYRTIGR